MWPCHTVPDEQEVDEVDSEDLLTTKRPKTDTKQRYTYCTSKTPCLNVHAYLSHNVVGTVFSTQVYIIIDPKPLYLRISCQIEESAIMHALFSTTCCDVRFKGIPQHGHHC